MSLEYTRVSVFVNKWSLVIVSKDWIVVQLVQTVFEALTNHCHHLLPVCHENGCTFLNYQSACPPTMILLLSLVHPQLRPLHNTSPPPTPHPHDVRLCMPSLCLISLLTVGMLSVFCFSFQFFHAQYHTEEVLCIPCQFQYVLPPHTIALLSFCVLHRRSSFSFSFSFCRHFGSGSLVALS